MGFPHDWMMLHCIILGGSYIRWAPGREEERPLCGGLPHGCSFTGHVGKQWNMDDVDICLIMFHPFGDMWGLFEIEKHDDNPLIHWNSNRET